MANLLKDINGKRKALALIAAACVLGVAVLGVAMWMLMPKTVVVEPLAYDDAWGNSNFDYRIPFHFTHAANQDMRVLVRLTDEDDTTPSADCENTPQGCAEIEYDDFNDDGEGIVFMTTAAVTIPHHIAVWDTGGTSYIWVSATLPSSIGYNPTDVYMYFGMDTASDYADIAGTWADHDAVWLFDSISGDMFADYHTGSAVYNAYNEGTVTATGGSPVGYGRAFTAEDGDEITVTHSAALGFGHNEKTESVTTIGITDSQYSPWIMTVPNSTTLYMYYCKQDNPVNRDCVYLLKSPANGVDDWANDTLVIDGTTETPGDPDDDLSCSPGVFIDGDDLWHMYYIASDVNSNEFFMYHATATLGIDWTVVGQVDIPDAVKAGGGYYWLETPSPIFEDDVLTVFFTGLYGQLYSMTAEDTDYHLFDTPVLLNAPSCVQSGRVTYADGIYYYVHSRSAGCSFDPPDTIYLATSSNGVDFYLTRGQPLMQSSGSGWDGTYMWSPHLVKFGQELWIYYAGTLGSYDWWGYNSSIGLRTLMPLCIEALVKFDADDMGSNVEIITKGSNDDNAGWALGKSAADLLWFRIGDGTTWHTAQNPWVNVYEDEWYYVLAVYDGGFLSGAKMWVFRAGTDGEGWANGGISSGDAVASWATHTMRIGSLEWSSNLVQLLDGTIGGYVSIRDDVPGGGGFEELLTYVQATRKNFIDYALIDYHAVQENTAGCEYDFDGDGDVDVDDIVTVADCWHVDCPGGGACCSGADGSTYTYDLNDSGGTYPVNIIDITLVVVKINTTCD